MGSNRANRIHARRRFSERYGVNLGVDLHDRLVAQIQRGEATLVEKLSTSRRMFDVQLGDGRTARVIYCKRHKTIVTALPPELPA